jgi:two-component system secretion response regulator SsrB
LIKITTIFEGIFQTIMTNKSVLALVVSSPGALQNGLLALLTTISSISAVLVAEDTESATRMVENHQPSMIILDMSLINVKEIIHQIKEQCPHIHLIVLAEDTAQQKVAEESGADGVLIKGFPAKNLIEIIESLINQREDTPLSQTDTEG